MSKVEDLERGIAELTPEELASFREWFAEFDAAAWDRELERDAKSGALDKFADEAIAEHRAGRTRPL